MTISIPTPTQEQRFSPAMKTIKGRASENIKRRGFGSPNLPRQRLLEICSMGGRRAHELGVAHEWTPEEAAIAGRIGGSISRRRRKVVRQES